MIHLQKLFIIVLVTMCNILGNNYNVKYGGIHYGYAENTIPVSPSCSTVVPALTIESDFPEKYWRRPYTDTYELTHDIAIKYPLKKIVKRYIMNDVWGIGENLIFSVDYGFYRAGTATMSVLGIEDINGGLCYKIQTTAQSNEFISSFYKVNDKVVSYVDVDGLFTRRFEKRLQEGRYKSNRFTDFYQDRLIALSTQKKYAVCEITQYVQDILSALYYLRTSKLEVGKPVTLDVFCGWKTLPLENNCPC